MTEREKDEVNEEIAEAVVVMAVVYLSRYMLRKRGASKVEQFVYASALTSLALIGKRLKDINETLKESL